MTRDEFLAVPQLIQMSLGIWPVFSDCPQFPAGADHIIALMGVPCFGALAPTRSRADR